jgi:signal transduction histidine kinase
MTSSKSYAAARESSGETGTTDGKRSMARLRRDREAGSELVCNSIVAAAGDFSGWCVGDGEPGSVRPCRVAVSDTGIGIPANELNAIFECFRHVERTDRTGLGLGLYIAKWIVTAHGGRIWVKSRVDGGSKFYFTLPAD